MNLECANSGAIKRTQPAVSVWDLEGDTGRRCQTAAAKNFFGRTEPTTHSLNASEAHMQRDVQENTPY